MGPVESEPAVTQKVRPKKRLGNRIIVMDLQGGTPRKS